MPVMTCQILFLGAPMFPAVIAHGICMKYNLLPCLKRPMDFGKSWRGKRIFGDHKTWRAPVVYVLLCVPASMLQAWLQSADVVPSWLFLADYREHGWLVGVLLGLGMTAGELPNSFLKRRLNVGPGRKGKGMPGIVFFLLDQVDLAIGIWVFLFLLIRPSLLLVAWSFVLTLVLHVGISSVGYLLGMRKTIV